MQKYDMTLYNLNYTHIDNQTLNLPLRLPFVFHL